MNTTRVSAVVIATLIMLILIVAVVFPYMILIRIMEYHLRFVTMRTPRVKISDIYFHLKTGDLLLFVAASHLPASSGLAQTFFSHAAMLMRDGDLIYTTESQAGSELMPDPKAPGGEYRMPPGAAAAPLLTRIKFYTGGAYVMRLSRALDPDREALLKTTADRLHDEKYAYPSMIQSIGSALGYKQEARHCFHHVAFLLDTAGLTPLGADKPLSDLGPIQACSEICDLPGRALPSGYYYDSPISIVYDISTMDCA